MNSTHTIFGKKNLVLLLLILNACSTFQLARNTTSTPVTPTATSTSAPLSTQTNTPTPVLTSSPTYTPIPTITHTPSNTPLPIYLLLRGEVKEHVSCFYGPSKAYLYKYGLLKGNRLDIIGYIADTGYIEVKAIGGHNPCWMNLKWMDVQGDIQTVQPINPFTIQLPESPYYAGLAWAKATRTGDKVKVIWDSLELRAGDGSEQEPYLLETWVCRAGKLTFVPIGLYDTETTVADEPGCSERSFARVYAVEKHGYTKALKIDWPQAEEHSK
jgi:hypothetical protein